MAPLVSVVVPVLGDAPAVARLLQGSPPDPRVETLIVDGGADPKLDDLTNGRPDVRVLRCRPGRGRQMNAGAAAASGHWLLFLHADSVLPPEWLSALPAAGSPVVGGWFRFALRRPGLAGALARARRRVARAAAAAAVRRPGVLRDARAVSRARGV